jgi:hypothetical protein
VNARGALAAVFAVSMLATCGASAQPKQADRVAAFARLPNWTGFWIAESRDDLGLSGRPPPGAPQNRGVIRGDAAPYTKEWAAKVEQQRKNNTGTAKECGFPFPFVMENPWVFQFLLTPEETVLLWGGREVRHVYTDGRRHPKPDELWPTPWGDSVGHWEGQTLVVDTIAVQPSRFPPSLSEQAHFTERLRMVGNDRFEDELTIEDPVAFTKPWTITIPYERVTDLDRMVHGLCDENDRNPVVDGKLTIAPAQH